MILFLLRFAQGFADKKWQACRALTATSKKREER